MIQETVADSKKSILFSLILKKIYKAYKFIHWFVYSNIYVHVLPNKAMR